MKIKALICALLCCTVLSAAAIASNLQEGASSETTQQAQSQQQGDMPRRGGGFGGRGGGRGMRPDRYMDGESTRVPTDEQQVTDDSSASENSGDTVQESGQMPPGDFGGRGGMGAPPEGAPGRDMQMPQQQTPDDAQTGETGGLNYFTLLSAAVLLVFGFVFVVFYKRKTF